MVYYYTYIPVDDYGVSFTTIAEETVVDEAIKQMAMTFENLN